MDEQANHKLDEVLVGLFFSNNPAWAAITNLRIHARAAEERIEHLEGLAAELAQSLKDMHIAVGGESAMNNPKYFHLGVQVTNLVFRPDVVALLTKKNLNI